MSDGYCPFADVVKIPTSNYATGADTTLAVALHIVQGSLTSCISHFKDPNAGVSAHFCIGKMGELKQFVSINDTAYAQGLNYDRQRHQWYTARKGEGRKNVTPSWSLLTPGMNINSRVISIEHEGKSGEPLTPAMQAMQTRVLRWIADQRSLVYVVGSTLIGHFMLDNVGREFCPGKAFDFPVIAMRANRQPVEPDWAALWGRDDYERVQDFGIPSAWRGSYRQGKPLGRAITDELQVRDRVVQIFENGYATYSPVTGVSVEMWP